MWVQHPLSPEEDEWFLGAGVTHSCEPFFLIWVLETELRCSSRAASALNLWAISLGYRKIKFITSFISTLRSLPQKLSSVFLKKLKWFPIHLFHMDLQREKKTGFHFQNRLQKVQSYLWELIWRYQITFHYPNTTRVFLSTINSWTIHTNRNVSHKVIPTIFNLTFRMY